MTQRAGREKHRCGLLADVAIANDRVAGLNTGFREQLPELVRRLEQEVVERNLREGNALRARDVAGALLPAVGAAALNTVVERRIASIDDRDAARPDVLLDVRGVHDDRLDVKRGKRTGARCRQPVGNLAALTDPRRHAAIE